MNRLKDLETFYEILADLDRRVGGKRRLSECDGRMGWPQRGVYFFFENGENRRDSGSGLRVVRVGTHAVSDGSKTKLWTRLRQHKGQEKSGGGRHRSSVFRGIVGTALAARDPNLRCVTWLEGETASKEIRLKEHKLECAVSTHIRSMPFLWLEVEGASSKDSMRSYIERNSIALLSNREKLGGERIDAPSKGWLGNYCPKEKVRESGLWNSNHVDDDYEPTFLDVLRKLVSAMAWRP